MIQEKSYRAIAVSPGFAIGEVLLAASQGEIFSPPEMRTITDLQVDAEIQRFKQAVECAKKELIALQKQLKDKVSASEVQIFNAHLAIIDDPMLNKEVIATIKNRKLWADSAFFQVAKRYVTALQTMPDEYLKERAADIRDAATRILFQLRPDRKSAIGAFSGQRIILAADLSPSDTAVLDRNQVLGFAVVAGSKTSHTAILARSMTIPALAGIPEELLHKVKNGDKVIIDGFSGTLILNPAPATEVLYQAKMEKERGIYRELEQDNRLYPETLDGFRVQLSANLEKLEDLKQIEKYGASGIGLFRTEYLFLGREELPGEEEQFQIYRQLLQGVGDDPVIIRTLDVGGDKIGLQIHNTAEANPFLGLRGIRLCLKARPDIFRTQLRALLRASRYGNLRVMLPMISCVEEVVEVKNLIGSLAKELRQEGFDCPDSLNLGAMIETPVAALMVSALAGIVDFFSIGTNDLIQYTMAIDRANDQVAYLYQPTHPAVLELIWRCAQEARKHNIWVGVCGQMASDPRYAALLVGLGVHELSMPPAAVAPIRRVIRKMRLFEAESAAQAAMAASTAAEALEIATDLLNRVAPEVSTLIGE